MAVIKRNIVPGCQIEIEAKTPVEAFDQLGRFSEILSIDTCKCGGGVKHERRNATSSDGKRCVYYSLRCLKCGMQFDFGQNQDGENLFAKHDKGWYRWTPDHTANDGGSQPQQQSQQPQHDETPF